eukprot:Nk52_evm1s2094 gene=Nk52_evmTU1s2094
MSDPNSNNNENQYISKQQEALRAAEEQNTNQNPSAPPPPFSNNNNNPNPSSSSSSAPPPPVYDYNSTGNQYISKQQEAYGEISTGGSGGEAAPAYYDESTSNGIANQPNGYISKQQEALRSAEENQNQSNNEHDENQPGDDDKGKSPQGGGEGDPVKDEEVHNYEESRDQLPVGESVHFKDEGTFQQSLGIKVKRHGYGYETSSKKVNQNSETLSQFLIYYNRFFPLVSLSVHGSHTELRTRTVRETDSQGRSRTRTETYTERVTDFSYRIPLTRFIDKTTGAPLMYAEYEGKGFNYYNPSAAYVEQERLMVMQQQLNSGGVQTALDYDMLLKQKLSPNADELVNRYVMNGNPAKKLKLRKYVAMDTEGLKSLVRTYIHGTLHYHGDVSLGMHYDRDEIRVRDSNAMSWLASTTCGRVTLGLSCMWIFFIPTYLIVKNCCYGEKEYEEEEEGDEAQRKLTNADGHRDSGSVASSTMSESLTKEEIQRAKMKKREEKRVRKAQRACKKELSAVWKVRPEFRSGAAMFAVIRNEIYATRRWRGGMRI